MPLHTTQEQAYFLPKPEIKVAISACVFLCATISAARIKLIAAIRLVTPDCGRLAIWAMSRARFVSRPDQLIHPNERQRRRGMVIQEFDVDRRRPDDRRQQSAEMLLR